MSAPVVHSVVVLAGDLFQAGKAAVGAHGLSRGRTTLAWANVAEIREIEREQSFKLLSGAAGAIALGTVASVFAGPLGIAAATAVGALNGLRQPRIVAIAAADGRTATLRISAAALEQARAWREGARAAISPDP